MSFDYFTTVKALKSVPCKDCGRTFDPVCMDFDHRPEETKVAGIVQFRYDEKRFWIEVAKCDVVCACCHRLRTKKRGYSEAARLKLRKPKPAGFGDKISKLKKGVRIGEARKNMGRPKSARIIIDCGCCGLPITLTAGNRRLKQKKIFCSVECRYA